jgi:hypothetical protein
MEMLLGNVDKGPFCLNLWQEGGECSASRPGRFTSRERAPGTHWIRGSLGPMTGLDAVVKKNARHRRESNPDSLVDEPVA